MKGKIIESIVCLLIIIGCTDGKATGDKTDYSQKDFEVVIDSVTYYWHQNTADDMMADSSYYEEVADYAMIDNIDIYACLADNE